MLKFIYNLAITTFFSITLGLGISLPDAQAKTQRCYQIEEKDQQNLCLAIVENRSSRCRSIKSMDSRYFCLAYVDKNSTRCYSIRNKDSRNMCLALIQAR